MAIYGIIAPLPDFLTPPMAKQYQRINDRLANFMREQQVFFVATAAADGRVNLSPKGMDTLRILNDRRVLWLNLTGSGNETAAHLLQCNRITVMFCAFHGTPLILRLYGTARVYHPRDREWAQLISHFEPLPGARQLIDVSVDSLSTSCGMAVPFYDYAGGRDALRRWAEKKGEEGLQDYWRDNNQRSVDDADTGILPLDNLT